MTETASMRLLAPVSAFNGFDLTGWVSDNPPRDSDPAAPALADIFGGVLTTPIGAVGHLVSEGVFSNYRLEVDYKLPSSGGGGSVLVHVSDLRVLRTKSKNIFPRSLDIKIRHGDAGDIYCIEENVDCPDLSRRPCEPGQRPGGRPEDARHIIKIEDAERPLQEWNRLAVECRDRSIRIWLNGRLVNEVFNCTTDRGKVALQVTEQPVEFRRVQLMPL